MKPQKSKALFQQITMYHSINAANAFALIILLTAASMATLQLPAACAQPKASQTKRVAPSRSDWGAPQVAVSHQGKTWRIAGKRTWVSLNEQDLSIAVKADGVNWNLVPSTESDLLVRWKGEQFSLCLAKAGKIAIKPYTTGFKTGVEISLSAFESSGLRTQGLPLDLVVFLTVCLEGDEEELVFESITIEREATVRQLDWPTALEASSVDSTVLSHVRGNLLPRKWPHPYHPFRNFTAGQEAADVTVDRTSIIVSHLVECWSMSWWGFQKGQAAMIVIVETPDDAGYQFSHPAGGPTVIGPRWLASLGQFRYPRSVRFCFFKKGNYVTLAKRYRQHVQDNGQFVSLKEKIARRPEVEKLIGAPHWRQYAKITAKSLEALPGLKSKPAGKRYDPKDPNKNYGLFTFDESAAQLRELKAKGIDRLNATMCAWPRLGYNRQHPDALPPAPEAGGWAGLKRWTDTCRELGYTCNLHDQYRDYYFDAASFNPKLAIHEEDVIGTPTAFPGSRFFGWKEGTMPVMDFWGGGKMAYLNSRFSLGHLKRNYVLFRKHGVSLNGIYIDVFGYVPPTEDFSPEHPITRSDCLKYRAKCFQWSKNNLGIVGTEDGCDWIIPYVDYTSDGNEGSCISIPLYNLVYHDAVMIPSGGLIEPLRCLLNGGFAWIGQTGGKPVDYEMLRRISALQKRVGLLEMTNHEFLDSSYRKERTTFSDGTMVTIDREKKTFAIQPPLKLDRE